MEYVHLIGAERVESAAQTMRSAADEMTRAAQSIEHHLWQHQRFLDDWISRFETAVEKFAKLIEPGEVKS